MGLTLVSPGALPVTLAQAKAHCRVDHNDDDALITLYIEAATAVLDGEDGVLGRCLSPQTWSLHYDEFPCGAIKIPLPPLIDVNFIKYNDGDGVEQTLPTTAYAVDLHQTWGWVVPAVGGWPTSASDIINAVNIQFYAGYPPPIGVPGAIKAAILECVGDLYKLREPTVVGTVSETEVMRRLINPYRIIF